MEDKIEVEYKIFHGKIIFLANVCVRVGNVKTTFSMFISAYIESVYMSSLILNGFACTFNHANIAIFPKNMKSMQFNMWLSIFVAFEYTSDHKGQAIFRFSSLILIALFSHHFRQTRPIFAYTKSCRRYLFYFFFECMANL